MNYLSNAASCFKRTKGSGGIAFELPLGIIFVSFAEDTELSARLALKANMGVRLVLTKIIME